MASQTWKAQTREQLQQCFRFLVQSMPEKGWRIEWSPWKDSRTIAQNNLLWMWNNEIQRFLAEHYGQIASAQEWHEIMVSKLWPSEIHRVELPDGTHYRVGRAKTSKFNVEQMTSYLEKLDAYCAQSLGLLLPHPADLMNAIYGERKVRRAA